MNDAQLLSCIPERAVGHETDSETDQIIVLKPRFGNGLIGRFLSWRSARTHVKIHLDPMGTWVWARCDGQASLADLADRMRDAFPEETEPTRRMLVFVRQLAGTGLLRLIKPTP